MTYQITLDHISEDHSGFTVNFLVTASLKEWAERTIPSRKERYLILAQEMRKAADYVTDQAGNMESPIGKPVDDQRFYP